MRNLSLSKTGKVQTTFLDRKEQYLLFVSSSFRVEYNERMVLEAFHIFKRTISCADAVFRKGPVYFPLHIPAFEMEKSQDQPEQ